MSVCDYAKENAHASNEHSDTFPDERNNDGHSIKHMKVVDGRGALTSFLYSSTEIEQEQFYHLVPISLSAGGGMPALYVSNEPSRCLLKPEEEDGGTVNNIKHEDHVSSGLADHFPSPTDDLKGNETGYWESKIQTVSCAERKKSGGVDTRASFTGEINFPYTCLDCNIKVQDCDALILHKDAMHYSKQQPFLCDICGLDVSNRAGLINHIPVHKRDTNSMCVICKKLFMNSKFLLKHIKVHMHTHFIIVIHEMMEIRKDIKEAQRQRMDGFTGKIHLPYTCKGCKQIFDSSSDLIEHKRSEDHIPFGSSRCDLCNFEARNKGGMVTHLLSHLNDIKTRCPICKKVFMRMEYCRKHVKTHGNVCFEKFSREVTIVP